MDLAFQADDSIFFHQKVQLKKQIKAQALFAKQMQCLYLCLRL